MKTTMHLVFAVFLLLLLFPGAGHAQFRPNDRDRDYRDYRDFRDFRRRGPRVLNGLRAGLNVSNLRDVDGEKLYPDNLTKYYIAYQRETPLLPLLHYGGGIELFVNGGRDNFQEELNMLYIAVPLSLRVGFGPAYGKAGVTGSMRLSAQEYENNYQIPVLRGKYRVFDYGFFLSGGVQFLIFFAEMRYTWGQLEVIDGYRNRQFQLGGGIMF